MGSGNARAGTGCDADLVVRCLIVDDSAGFLLSARRLLERQGVAVAGVAASGTEAVRQVEELRPDVVLVDIDLGAESGLDVAERLPTATKIILISTHSEQDYRDLIRASAAIGFLAKTALSGRAIRELLDGAA